jgi:hypothetical protein
MQMLPMQFLCLQHCLRLSHMQHGYPIWHRHLIFRFTYLWCDEQHWEIQLCHMMYSVILHIKNL